MSDEAKKQQFLDGLTKLTRETGFGVGACGCCDSPWVTDRTYEGTYYENSRGQLAYGDPPNPGDDTEEHF
jgi:hypothetical protein